MLPVTYGHHNNGHGPLLAAQRRGAGVGPPGAGKRGAGRAGPSCRALALLLLLGCCGLLGFGWLGLSGDSSGAGALAAAFSPAPRRRTNRKALEQPRRFPAPHLRSLVLVACHSVYTGLNFSAVEDPSSWHMLDYQKVPGQAHSFVEHIQLGVGRAARDPGAMLLFSGGKTRRDAGPRAEAMGYWLVAESNRWFGTAAEVRDRAFTEEHARDSLENVLFGLCRFYELTGRYPETLAIVGYEFKRKRFAGQHAAALRWPLDRLEYLGTPALNPGAEEGEAKTLAAFELDPYGCAGELAAKRAKRDPFADGGYAAERCPALGALLEHCGPQIFGGALPWDGLSTNPSNTATS